MEGEMYRRGFHEHFLFNDLVFDFRNWVSSLLLLFLSFSLSLLEVSGGVNVRDLRRCIDHAARDVPLVSFGHSDKDDLPNQRTCWLARQGFLILVENDLSVGLGVPEKLRCRSLFFLSDPVVIAYDPDKHVLGYVMIVG